jgi:hypothetical protein
MFDAIANMKLSDLLQAPPVGEPVNVHVVNVAPEPRDDFAEMQKIVSGDPVAVPSGQPPVVEPNTGV